MLRLKGLLLVYLPLLAPCSLLLASGHGPPTEPTNEDPATTAGAPVSTCSPHASSAYPLPSAPATEVRLWSRGGTQRVPARAATCGRGGCCPSLRHVPALPVATPLAALGSMTHTHTQDRGGSFLKSGGGSAGGYGFPGGHPCLFPPCKRKHPYPLLVKGPQTSVASQWVWNRSAGVGWRPTDLGTAELALARGSHCSRSAINKGQNLLTAVSSWVELHTLVALVCYVPLPPPPQHRHTV